MPSLGVTLPTSPPGHQPESSLNSIQLGFCGGFITEAGMVINSIFSPSPLREWGVGLTVPSFLLWLVFPVT